MGKTIATKTALVKNLKSTKTIAKDAKNAEVKNKIDLKKMVQGEHFSNS